MKQQTSPDIFIRKGCPNNFDLFASPVNQNFMSQGPIFKNTHRKKGDRKEKQKHVNQCVKKKQKTMVPVIPQLGLWY